MPLTVTAQAPAPGEKVSAAIFGDPVVNDLTALVNAVNTMQVFAYKSANESLASSTVLHNDGDLFVAGAANSVYDVDMFLRVSGAGSASVGDIKLAFTFPTGASAQLSVGYMGLTFGVAYGVSTAGSVNAISTINTTSPSTTNTFGTPQTNFSTIMAKGLWIVGATPGNLQLQWAQSVSTATATVVAAGSYIKIMRRP